MPVAMTRDSDWTAEAFLATDQAAFGDAWRYEFVDGHIVAHAAPAPDHGAIIAGLATVLGRLLAGRPGGCRPEIGSGAVPKSAQRNNARIPEVMVRCGQHPRVVFDVVSPHEIRDWRGRDLTRKHLQAIEGVQEIVELSQVDFAVHVYRLAGGSAWTFEAVDGADGVLRLDSLGADLPLAEIYAFTDLPTADPASAAEA